MAKCVVTGGAGFVGSHLADKLIETGHSVAVIDNLVSGKKEYVHPGAKFYLEDINSNQIRDIFSYEKPDYIFHLAGQLDVKKSVEDPMYDRKVNVDGSFNIFNTASETGVKKVIFVSTGGALYGDCLEPAHEESKLKSTSPYGIHKRTAEKYLEYLKDLKGMPYAVIRPSNIYGPRQFKGGECGVISIFTNNHHEGTPSMLYGDGTKTRDYVYVLDVVDSMIRLLNSEKEGIYNIGSGRETNNLEIIKMIENLTNKKFAYKLAQDKPGEVQRSCLSYRKIKDELGWEPKVQLEDGVKNVFAWLKSKNER